MAGDKETLSNMTGNYIIYNNEILFKFTFMTEQIFK